MTYPNYPPPNNNPACQCRGNPMRQMFCMSGHMTECHYPYDCATAGCSHLARYDYAPDQAASMGAAALEAIAAGRRPPYRLDNGRLIVRQEEQANGQGSADELQPSDEMEGAIQELINVQTRSRPIALEIPPIEAFFILSLLQLALRHPHMDQASAPASAGLALGQALQEYLARLSPTIGKAAAAGWDPQHDTPASPDNTAEHVQRAIDGAVVAIHSLNESARPGSIAHLLRALEDEAGEAEAGQQLITNIGWMIAERLRLGSWQHVHP